MTKLLNMGKRRRAISPAITGLIMLGIAVAAGGVVYSVFNTQSSVAQVQGAISIEQMSLVQNPSGETWFSATIKNAGNKVLDSSTINLQEDTDLATAGMQPFTASPSPASLNPGQTSSVFVRVDDSGGSAITTLNIGDTIPVQIMATTPDGSTISVPSSVTVGLS